MSAQCRHDPLVVGNSAMAGEGADQIAVIVGLAAIDAQHAGFLDQVFDDEIGDVVRRFSVGHADRAENLFHQQ